MRSHLECVPPIGESPFAQAIRIGCLVLVSGQASVDGRGRIVPDTFEGEVRRSIENLEAVLHTGWGVGLESVVQVRSYLADASDIPKHNEVYREYFSPPFPVRTTLTGCLGRIKYELDAIAVLEPDGFRG